MKFSEQEILEKLKAIALFQGFAGQPATLQRIASVLEPKKAAKGTRIITEGEAGDEMFILLKGEIEISKFTMEKEQFTVARLKDSMNIFFGELAMVDEDRRSASVTALTDCDLLVLTRDRFRRLGQEHNEIGFVLTLEIAGLLSKRLRKSNEDAVVLFEALVNELANQ